MKQQIRIRKMEPSVSTTNIDVGLLKRNMTTKNSVTSGKIRLFTRSNLSSAHSISRDGLK